MNAVSSYREGLRWAYELLEMVMADVTPEQAHATPPGIANPLGAIYAHAIIDLDLIPHNLFQGKPGLFQTTWAGKTGISDPQWQMTLDWARRVEVDLPALQAYAKAAFESADAYLASLRDDDLEGEVDLTGVGFGMQKLSWCLSALVIGHLNNMAGEISVLKGIQGVKGYPF